MRSQEKKKIVDELFYVVENVINIKKMRSMMNRKMIYINGKERKEIL